MNATLDHDRKAAESIADAVAGLNESLKRIAHDIPSSTPLWMRDEIMRALGQSQSILSTVRSLTP